MTKKEVLHLTDKWNPGAYEVFTAGSLEMLEVSDAEFREDAIPHHR